MPIKLLTGILLILLTSCSTSKQASIPEVSATQTVDIEMAARSFEVDKLGRMYLMDRRNQLHLYSPTFQKLYNYNNNRLGKLETIDVSNPLKILLFYRDFDMVVLLDTYLGETRIIDLKAFDYFNIPAICLSNDNQIWLYNLVDFKLHKIDERGKEVNQSLSLLDKNIGDFVPQKIIETGNYVMMNDPKKGLVLFDNFGQFIKQIPILGIEDFQSDGQYIIYKKGNQIYNYSIRAVAEKAIEFDEEYVGIKKARFQGNQAYFLFVNGLKRQKY